MAGTITSSKKKLSVLTQSHHAFAWKQKMSEKAELYLGLIRDVLNDGRYVLTSI